MTEGYLGDGVYFRIIDCYTIAVYLSNGVEPVNEIFFDEVMITRLNDIVQETLYERKEK